MSMVSALSVPINATAADSKAAKQRRRPLQVEFGRAQFDEVRAVVASRYLETELKAAHLWAAAANGALSALHRKIELLPSGFVALKKFSESRFSGKTEPFTCQGRALPGVVIHHIPRRPKNAKKYGAGDGGSTGEPLVDALLNWPPPFSEADFHCVVAWVQGQIVSRSDPVTRGGRIKRLPESVARSRRSQLWLTATRWLLRALDPHSRLTTKEAWTDVTASVDVATRQRDVTVRPLPSLPGGVLVRIRKFAPGGDQRVRTGLAAIQGRITAIVLDMRGNPGGIMPVAVGVIETFVRGGLVARVKTRDTVVGVPISRRRRRVFDAPMTVLINPRCASACEFTSASLQDSLRALVVGERSYGKATLQEYTQLKSTAAKVMVTVGMFFSPTGHPIQATGISPDLVVTVKPDAKETNAQREEDVPFHLQAETLAEFRDVSFWRPYVRRCVAASVRPPTPPADWQLHRATDAVRCLASVKASFKNGTLAPLKKSP